MEELSIKIRIADRDYPMKIKREDEEILRIAGRAINDKIKDYRQQYGIDDIQDLLSMVAFDSVVSKMKEERDLESFDQVVATKVDYFNNLLSQ